ncbi:MAG TPA: xanthine dehydrogenase family protein subunit M [Gaiellaceae bacterium]
MLLAEVEYVRPKTVDEAIGLLSAHDGARALAGGQTLVNVMKARAASPDVLVDLQDIEELRGVRDLGNGSVEIGAMTTCAQLIGDEAAGARSILGEVASKIADVQVRNRGTIGGNVCSNDPTNHLPPLLVALDASFTIAASGGERTVPAHEFFLGVYLTAAGPGELLTRITIPPGGQDGFTAVTIGRDGSAIVTAAASLNGGARIAIGCVDAVPVRARQMEERIGSDYSDANVRAAAEGLGATLDPPSDVHAAADYRRQLAEVLAARAVVAARERR